MRRRPGYAGFVAASVALHGALVAIPFPAPVRLAPEGSAAEPAAAGESGARERAGDSAAAPVLRSALRGAFLVVNGREAEAEPARAAAEVGFEDPAEAGEDGRRAWEALAAAALQAAAGSPGPRMGGPASGESGRLVPPAPVRVVWPEYPASSLRSGSGGSVLVRVHVTREGRVDSVKIERSLSDPVLDAAALRAARSLLFEPARLDGRPVGVWFTYPVTFTP